ncbi:MAG: thiamine pyrophosphate-requiring protein [Alphaproteobacteria bacterium]|nr:thiamine pyrophosphate-requiring protein [Alphaproteobacteria bacterium]
MATTTIRADSTAEAYLALLADRGVEYLFGNSGTDFPSIIEALSKAAATGSRAPIPVTVPHENVAVAMAHGFYLVSGRPQAVMVHVTVGTANAVCGIMNAAREHVPIIFSAGRSPLTEEGLTGARSLYIHWGQEMFDQAGMVRELVKWDYELRNAHQLETVVDRAINIAMSEPRGPIYLTLPREVLAEAPGAFAFDTPSRRQAARPTAPDAAAIEKAADIIAAATNPVLISSSYGQEPDAVPTLARLVDRFAIPVVAYRPRYVVLPSDHPMHMGYEPAALIKDADAIVVVDSDVPWIPSLHKIAPTAKVIHFGADPLFSDYVVRGYPCDLAVAGSSHNAMKALDGALAARAAGARDRIALRRAAVAKRREAMAAQRRAAREAAAGAAPLDLTQVAACIDAAKAPDDIVVSESQIPIAHMTFSRPGTYFAASPAGGLGWGLGAALGIKLAAPERRVISIVGDGSYMFGNPTPAHYVGAANGLPVLTVILNNRMWGAVRKATLGIYPDGAAARINRAPLTYLQPSPEYHRIVAACGGWGEEVKTPDALPAALDRALKVVTEEKRAAVLNVATSYDDAAAAADAKR